MLIKHSPIAPPCQYQFETPFRTEPVSMFDKINQCQCHYQGYPCKNPLEGAIRIYDKDFDISWITLVIFSDRFKFSLPVPFFIWQRMIWRMNLFLSYLYIYSLTKQPFLHQFYFSCSRIKNFIQNWFMIST